MYYICNIVVDITQETVIKVKQSTNCVHGCILIKRMIRRHLWRGN